jgi:hypothetical protein
MGLLRRKVWEVGKVVRCLLCPTKPAYAEAASRRQARVRIAVGSVVGVGACNTTVE